MAGFFQLLAYGYDPELATPVLKTQHEIIIEQEYEYLKKNCKKRVYKSRVDNVIEFIIQHHGQELVFQEGNVVTYMMNRIINSISLNDVILHLHNVIIPKIQHRKKMKKVFDVIRALPGIGIDYQNAALRFKENSYAIK